MAFVYRYSTPPGTPRYIGIVKGNTMADLQRRIKEHSNEDKFKGHAWVIEYIDGLTITDAELLEAHFIGLYGESLYNIAKQHFGPITIEIKKLPEWKQLADSKWANNKTIRNKAPLKLPHARIQSFVCSCCGSNVCSPPNVVEIFLRTMNYSRVDVDTFWLCNNCKKRVRLTMEKLRSEYMKHGLTFMDASFAGVNPAEFWEG